MRLLLIMICINAGLDTALGFLRAIEAGNELWAWFLGFLIVTCIYAACRVALLPRHAFD